jgi:hypothetical protein
MAFNSEQADAFGGNINDTGKDYKLKIPVK